MPFSQFSIYAFKNISFENFITHFLFLLSKLAIICYLLLLERNKKKLFNSIRKHKNLNFFLCYIKTDL